MSTKRSKRKAAIGVGALLALAGLIVAAWHRAEILAAVERLWGGTLSAVTRMPPAAAFVFLLLFSIPAMLACGVIVFRTRVAPVGSLKSQSDEQQGKTIRTQAWLWTNLLIAVVACVALAAVVNAAAIYWGYVHSPTVLHGRLEQAYADAKKAAGAAIGAPGLEQARPQLVAALAAVNEILESHRSELSRDDLAHLRVAKGTLQATLLDKVGLSETLLELSDVPAVWRAAVTNLDLRYKQMVASVPASSASANERRPESERVTQADSAVFVQAEGLLDHNDPKGAHDLLLPMLPKIRASSASQSLGGHEGMAAAGCALLALSSNAMNPPDLATAKEAATVGLAVAELALKGHNSRTTWFQLSKSRVQCFQELETAAVALREWDVARGHADQAVKLADEMVLDQGGVDFVDFMLIQRENLEYVCQQQGDAAGLERAVQARVDALRELIEKGHSRLVLKCEEAVQDLSKLREPAASGVTE